MIAVQLHGERHRKRLTRSFDSVEGVPAYADSFEGPTATKKGNQYASDADGQRFLVVTPREQKSSTPLTLVQNWTALLKKK